MLVEDEADAEQPEGQGGQEDEIGRVAGLNDGNALRPVDPEQQPEFVEQGEGIFRQKGQLAARLHRQRVAVDFYAVDLFIFLAVVLVQRADDADPVAGVAQGFRFLPDAAVEGNREILDDDDAGAGMGISVQGKPLERGAEASFERNARRAAGPEGEEPHGAGGRTRLRRIVHFDGGANPRAGSSSNSFPENFLTAISRRLNSTHANSRIRRATPRLGEALSPGLFPPRGADRCFSHADPIRLNVRAHLPQAYTVNIFLRFCMQRMVAGAAGRLRVYARGV